MATSHKKKDYYQFCYDENEVISSCESSFDEDSVVLNSPGDDNGCCGSNEDLDNENEEVENEEVENEELENEEVENEDGNSSIESVESRQNSATSSPIPQQESMNDDSYTSTSKCHVLPTGRRSKSCCLEPRADLLDMPNVIFSSDSSNLSSPVLVSSTPVRQAPIARAESIHLDGYVIEIDESTNTINVSPSCSTPSQHSDISYDTSTNGFGTPDRAGEYENSSREEDELSSSGVSLDSGSILSSANSLTTEIDRLRNIYSPMHIRQDTPFYHHHHNHRRRYRISDAAFGCEDRLSSSKSAKSLNSLLTRSSTPDRRSPLLDFLKLGKKGIRIGEAKSDCDLNKKKNAPNAKKQPKDSSVISVFRLKRSSSVFKNKRNSKQKNASENCTSGGGICAAQCSDPELTLQQPSPFVRTIFQFVESDNDELLPCDKNFENYIVPVFSCNRKKLLQDLGKTNSLSRRASKNKNNLSSIQRTVYQDGHDPIFLSSCRRLSENSDFLISTIAFLDRVRKVQESSVIPSQTTQKLQPARRNTIDHVNDTTVKSLEKEFEAMDDTRFNSIRRKLHLPLTIHERFSALSDSGVFDEELMLSSSDCIFKGELSKSKSRSFTAISSPKNSDTESKKNNGAFERRSKSLKNLAYGSFRKKDKRGRKHEKVNNKNEKNVKKDILVNDQCERDEKCEDSILLQEQQQQNILNTEHCDADNALHSSAYQKNYSHTCNSSRDAEHKTRENPHPRGRHQVLSDKKNDNNDNDVGSRKNRSYRNISTQVESPSSPSDCCSSDAEEKMTMNTTTAHEQLKHKETLDHHHQHPRKQHHKSNNNNSDNDKFTTTTSVTASSSTSAGVYVGGVLQNTRNCSTTTIINSKHRPTPRAHSDPMLLEKHNQQHQHYKPIRFLTDKLRHKNKKSSSNSGTSTRAEPEAEYSYEQNFKNSNTGTGSSRGISMEKHQSPAVLSSFDDEPDSETSPKGVSDLRKQFEEVKRKESGNEKIQFNPSTLDKTSDCNGNKQEHKEVKRKSGIRRSLSWRLKKQKDDGTTSPESPTGPLSPKEKGNRFSSLRSKFEATSPTEKKKWNLLRPLSPSAKKTHYTTPSKQSTTTLDDASDDMPTSLSAPRCQIDLMAEEENDDHRGDNNDINKAPTEEFLSAMCVECEPHNERKVSSEMLRDIISGCSSSELFSGNNLFFPEQKLNKLSRSSRKSSSDSPATSVGPVTNMKNQEEEHERIVVDVPLHLLPPEIGSSSHQRSPRSSPRTSLRHSSSSVKSTSPIMSPLTIVKRKKRPPEGSNNASGRRSSSEASRDSYAAAATGEKKSSEINNNNSLQLRKTSSDAREENQNRPTVKTKGAIATTTPSPPAVKPKPTKTRSVAVVKPKTLPSNIAMVSPIMKSDITSSLSSPHVIERTAGDRIPTSSEQNRNLTTRTVKKRPTALLKWKNLENTETVDSSTTTSSSSRQPSRSNTSSRIRRQSGSSAHTYMDKIEKQNTDDHNNKDNNKELEHKTIKKAENQSLDTGNKDQHSVIDDLDNDRVSTNEQSVPLHVTESIVLSSSCETRNNNVDDSATTNDTKESALISDSLQGLSSISQITGAIEQLTANNDVEITVPKKRLSYVDSAKSKRKSCELPKPTSVTASEEADLSTSLRQSPNPISRQPPATSPKPRKVNRTKNIKRDNASILHTENLSEFEKDSKQRYSDGGATLKRKRRTNSVERSTRSTLEHTENNSSSSYRSNNTETSEMPSKAPTAKRSIADICGLKINAVDVPVTHFSDEISTLKRTNKNRLDSTSESLDNSNRESISSVEEPRGGKNCSDTSEIDDNASSAFLDDLHKNRTVKKRRTPISNIFPVNSSRNAGDNIEVGNGFQQMPKITADGKPIGYATKIMCNGLTIPNKDSQQHHWNSSTFDEPSSGDNNSGNFDLDGYIKNSFRDIEQSVRESVEEMRSSSLPINNNNNNNVVYNVGGHPATNGHYTEQLTPYPFKNPSDDDHGKTTESRFIFPNNNSHNPPSPLQERTKLRDRIRLRKEAVDTSSSTHISRAETIKASMNEKYTYNSHSNNDNTFTSGESFEKVDDVDVHVNPTETIDHAVVLRTDNNSDSIANIETLDTMKEFEAFLLKQEKKAKREMYRLSQEEPKFITAVEPAKNEKKERHTTALDGDFTLENYRKQQLRRRKERQEFQQHHLSERRRSLGILPNKWASASNIFLCSTMDDSRPLQRKLSLPHDIHKQANYQSSESVDDECTAGRDVNSAGRDVNSKGGVTHCESFDFERSNFESDSLKQRSNSTGHSPDSQNLLGHLICDIEEEIKSSCSDDSDGNCESVKYPSDDNLKTFGQKYVKRNRTSPLRRAHSENLHGKSPLRRLRSREKRSWNNNSSDESVRSRQQNIETGDNALTINLTLLLDQDAERKCAVRITDVNVPNTSSYQDIEDMVIRSFLTHLQLLDKQMLDIGKEDLMCLQIGKKKVPIGSSLDMSSMNVENGLLPCQLCLKGRKEWSLAAMAYDTLIPKTYLEKYVSLILTHRQVIFYGPSGTGKSYVARRVASIITERMNENRIPTIIFKNITELQWKTLLRSITDEKKSEPYVVLLDGFAPSFIKSEKDLTEIISACETVHPQPYVMCTVTQSPNYEIPTPWQNSFKWIWLPNHEEPVDGLLQRYLRRRALQTDHKDTQPDAFRIADWLAFTWRHINDILEKYNSTECTIGPTMFYTCPTDISCVEEWFVDLWNYSITPYFIQTVKSGLKLFGQRYDWLDPLECILKTYPWTAQKSERIVKLRRIRPEDVGYQPNNSSSSPCPSSPTQYSETEKERLLDFLRQLELLMHDGGLGELPAFDENARDPIESSI